MADLRNYQGRVQTGEMIDQGLRSYMLKVYNLMALGLAITGVAAYLSFQFAFANGDKSILSSLQHPRHPHPKAVSKRQCRTLPGLSSGR